MKTLINHMMINRHVLVHKKQNSHIFAAN